MSLVFIPFGLALILFVMYGIRYEIKNYDGFVSISLIFIFIYLAVVGIITVFLSVISYLKMLIELTKM